MQRTTAFCQPSAEGSQKPQRLTIVLTGWFISGHPQGVRAREFIRLSSRSATKGQPPRESRIVLIRRD